MKQTGIRYLAEQLKYYDFEKSEQSYVFKISVAKFNELIERAKAIEKEQIIDLIQFLSMNQDFNSYSSVSKETAKYFLEQYYNKTYGQNRD